MSTPTLSRSATWAKGQPVGGGVGGWSLSDEICGVTDGGLTGHTYTTRPGSVLLFTTLCEPTGTLVLPEPTEVTLTGDRGVMMPKRRRTRARDRAYRIAAERRLNDAYVAERNRPPPF